MDKFGVERPRIVIFKLDNRKVHKHFRYTRCIYVYTYFFVVMYIYIYIYMYDVIWYCLMPTAERGLCLDGKYPSNGKRVLLITNGGGMGIYKYMYIKTYIHF